jgi:methylase of polypeptide subunit release factors
MGIYLTQKPEVVRLAKKIAKNNSVDIKINGGIKIRLLFGVFIPDLETFDFVEAGKKLIYRLDKKSVINTIADVGTGSGVIGIHRDPIRISITCL